MVNPSLKGTDPISSPVHAKHKIKLLRQLRRWHLGNNDCMGLLELLFLEVEMGL